MEIGYFILIIFILAFFPIFRFIISRVFLLFKLHRCCKRNGFEFGINGFLAPFKKINGTGNDMYIKTDRCIYSIKLFGFFSRKKYFCFGEDNTYHFKDLSFPVLPSIAFSREYKTKKHSNCNFESFLPSTGCCVGIKPCFLLSPTLSKGMKISCIRNNKMIEIISGDRLSDAYFYTLDGLVKELDSQN